jgi:ELWxxDGT repeat protein
VKLDNVMNDNTTPLSLTRTVIGNGDALNFNSTGQLILVKNATANGEDVLYLAATTSPNGSAGREVLKLVDPLNADENSSLQLVANINPDGSSDPRNLTVFNGKLYFTATATGEESDRKLWYSDGITTTAIDISGVNGGYSPSSLTVVGNTLFLVANDGSTGVELWKTTGTTLTQVQNLNQAGDSNPQNLVAIGDALFFIADNGEDGLEVWSVGESNDII